MKYFIACMVLFSLISQRVQSQERIIKGVVRDAFTHEPVINALIRDSQRKVIGQSDLSGNFTLEANAELKTILFSSVGYEEKVLELNTITGDVEILLKEKTTTLAEVRVKKRRYRNKDNPAVELIREVIRNKNSNRNTGFDYLNFNEHEKVRIGLVNERERLEKHPVVKLFPSLREKFDSLKIEGKVVLPLYIQERFYDNFLTPSRQVRNVLEEKKVTFDENIFDNEGINMYLSFIYQPFDIYENNMMVVTTQFVSPISELAPTFYMYDIVDTVTVNDGKRINLLITPRNSGDLLFWGNMQVDLDTYAVTDIKLNTGKGINLNWVRGLEMHQKFSKNSADKFSLTESRTQIEFSLTQKSRESFFTDRIVKLSDYHFNEPFDIRRVETQETPVQLNLHDKPGSEEDQMIYSTLDSLKDTKRFRTLSSLISLAGYGYFDAGKKFEVGHVGTFFGKRPLEGFRARLGGRTMPAFSDKVFLEGYGAYGFEDRRWKYYGAITYSLTGKNKYVFPMKNITVSYRTDMEIPGNNLRFVNDYNFLMSFARGDNDKWIYYRRFAVRYVQEFQNRFSFRIGLERTIQEPAGALFYRPENSDPHLRYLTLSEFKTELRYAPHERFYQGKTGRSVFTTKYPVFTLRASAAFDGLLGSRYTYQKAAFNVHKRFFLSPAGYTDAVFEAGGTFGRNLPFPVLDIMIGNQTYTFQENSYNMMNFMEFVADRFVSAKLEHNFNGTLLNKIPLISKFKFREYLSFKVLYGHLSGANRPGENTTVFQFPQDEAGNPIMYSLGNRPYMEGGIGIGNIFRILRIDVVKRFSYLHHYNVPDIGLRMRFDMKF